MLSTNMRRVCAGISLVLLPLACSSLQSAFGPLSSPTWSAARTATGERITMSVKTAAAVRTVTFTVWETRRGGAADRALFTKTVPVHNRRAECEWRYACATIITGRPHGLPRVYFIATAETPSGRAQSASIVVADSVRMETVDGRGKPMRMFYVAEGRDAQGRIVHRLKGITGVKRPEGRGDLDPCLKYRLYIVGEQDDKTKHVAVRGTGRWQPENYNRAWHWEFESFSEEWGDTLAAWGGVGEDVATTMGTLGGTSSVLMSTTRRISKIPWAPRVAQGSNRKYGFVDSTGRWFGQPQYDEIKPFLPPDPCGNPRQISIHLEKKQADFRSTWYKPTHDTVLSFSREYLLAPVRRDGAWYVMEFSKGGGPHSGPIGSWKEYGPFGEGLFPFRSRCTKELVYSLMGYINTDGDVIIAPKFRFASQFADGRALVEIQPKAGSVRFPGQKFYTYIDTRGEGIIEPFEVGRGAPSLFSNGRASVMMKQPDGGWYFGYIDTAGKTVIGPDRRFEDAEGFRNGIARVKYRDDTMHRFTERVNDCCNLPAGCCLMTGLFLFHKPGNRLYLGGGWGKRFVSAEVKTIYCVIDPSGSVLYSSHGNRALDDVNRYIKRKHPTWFDVDPWRE